MAGPKRVAIYSEGFGSDVKIMNEDGEVLNGIYSADITIEAGSLVVVKLEVHAPALNVQSAAVTRCDLICPLCQAAQEHECGTQSLSVAAPLPPLAVNPGVAQP